MGVARLEGGALCQRPPAVFGVMSSTQLCLPVTNRASRVLREPLHGRLQPCKYC